MKKSLAVLATAALLSLGITACNGGTSSDCESSGPTGVVAMAMTDGKSGGSFGGRGRSTVRKPSVGKSKPGSSKPKRHKHHDFDDDCDD